MASRWFWNEHKWLSWKCYHSVVTNSCRTPHFFLFVIEHLFMHRYLAVKPSVWYHGGKWPSCKAPGRQDRTWTGMCKVASWPLFWMSSTAGKRPHSAALHIPVTQSSTHSFLVKNLQESVADKFKCTIRPLLVQLFCTFKVLNEQQRNTGTRAKRIEGTKTNCGFLQNHAIKCRGQGYNSLLKFSFLLS